MRLRRLDLVRYGKFTDRSLDFGERPAGAPDLHLVYGPNEAGKSTALSAYLDLLFGIGKQSPYDFLHPYSTMRIGATLDFAHGTRTFTRLKRPQASLLDGRDQPVSGDAILAELGGIDRDAYRTMFSLDDETIEAGGEAILASRGNLGEMLFSASAGLADLGRRLVQVKAEADGFYRFHAHGGALSDLKAELARLKVRRDEIDLQAGEHARLVAERDRAAALYDAAAAEEGAARAALEAIRRRLGAAPRLVRLRLVRARLALLAALPEVAPEGFTDVRAWREEEVALAVRREEDARAVAELAQKIEAAVVDEQALGAAAPLGALDGLRARHVTAEKDLPDRQQRLQSEDLAVARLLERLGRAGEAEPGRLLLRAATETRLGDLIAGRSGIDAAVHAAASERDRVRRALADAEAALEEIGPAVPAVAIAALAATARHLAGVERAPRRRLAGALERAEATLDERLRALAPWRGEPAALAGTIVPDPATIERWKTEEARIRGRIDRFAEEAERSEAAARRLAAERDAIAQATGVVSDQEAASLRAAREQAWAEHRRALDAATADGFEALLRRDDLVTAGRVGHVADLARLHATAEALAVAGADRERTAALEAGARSALAALAAEWAAALRTIGLPPDLPLRAFESWIAARTSALRAREDAAAAARELHDAEETAAETRDRLVAALQATGLAVPADAGFDALLAIAEAAVARGKAVEDLRRGVEECRRTLVERERGAVEAAASEAAWTASWAEACRACWLGERTVPDVATVRGSLPVLAALAAALDRRADLADRVAKMQQDQGRFAEAITGLAETLGLPSDGASPLETAGRIDARIAAAKGERLRREGLVADQAALATARSALLHDSAILARRKAELTSLFAVDTLAEVEDRLAGLAERAGLRREVAELEAEILEALRAPSLVDAEAALDGIDRAALETEAATLDARLPALAHRVRELFAERAAAAGKLAAIVGDDGVARIEEERRTLLLAVEEGAIRYLRLRAGTAATEHALRLYRERHRSAMMRRASDAFRLISRGAYRELATQPEKDGEALIALAADGASKRADAMSKGTRFQLYLALRAAGYAEFAEARSPVPFVADDIMETFDDFRAEEAFRLLAEMGRVGQVIYLTHHRHLCEIAEAASPGVRIHTLEA